MPNKPEPIGKIYPVEKFPTAPTVPTSPISNDSSSKAQPLDNTKNVPSTLKN
jgi:hypothetical protein